MDELTAVQQFIEAIGFAESISVGLVAIFLLAIISLPKKISKFNTSLETIMDKVQTPYLQRDQSINIYKLVTGRITSKILEYLARLYEGEDIAKRQDQLQVNVRREIKAIIHSETAKLSSISSVCGDMGKIIRDDLKWDFLYSSINSIYFDKNASLRSKLDDIRLLTDEIFQAISNKVNDNGIHN